METKKDLNMNGAWRLAPEKKNLPEAASSEWFAPENGWLESMNFLWGWPIFNGQTVSFREDNFHREIIVNSLKKEKRWRCLLWITCEIEKKSPRQIVFNELNGCFQK